MSFKHVVLGVLSGALVLFSQNSFAVTYNYDDLGRLIEVIYDSGRKVTYSYDPAGNRIEHEVIITSELPINDNIATLGIGNNFIDLSGWPVGDAPAGAPTVTGWNNNATFYNEARWTRVTGPGQSSSVTTMEAGQTEADANGGGSFSNSYTIDRTKAYEFSIYFQKHDLAVQNIYMGMTTSGGVERISTGAVTTNPYFMAWDLSAQATYLAPNKWYKAVGYIFPEGYPLQSNSVSGGVYDVETGVKLNDVFSFRWNENTTSNSVYSRFFTYYSEAVQNRYTTYFYQPEVRVTNISYVPVVPALSISHSNATEGSNITYNVNLSVATTVDVKVNYVVGGGSASANDYTAVSGTLIIPEGNTQGTITVNTTADSNIEPDETIQLTLSAPVRATIAEATELATILTDDLPPSFSVNNVSIAEGGNLTFTVTKTGATGLSHNVTYATANNSAVAGSDYTTKSGTLTFTSGQTSQTVTVVTTGDSTYENNESLYLNLTSPTAGAIITDAQGVGTINNNDAGPSFAVNNVSASEGNNIAFVITKSGSTALSHNVSYTTTSGTAGTSDYTTKSGTATFAAGTTTQTITVVGKEDTTYESNEVFYLDLSGATSGATISDSRGNGTVTNDDTAPSFAVNNVSASEGNNLAFVITKSGSTALSHNVSYTTTSGTAGTSDYTTKSGTATFAAGTTTQTVTVVGKEDTTYESNEVFYLDLSGATSGATISDSRGNGTVTNDDAAPSFSINNVSVTEGGTLSFTVTKTGSTALSHNINYATANGTATAGSDYTSKSGTLSFTSGQSTKTISVVTTQETLFEPNETLYVNLSGATNSATISDTQGLGTINNDDDSGFIIAVNSSGAVQSPYTTEITGSGNFTFISLKDGAGTAVYFGAAASGLCSGGTFLDPNYSWSGNGCEIIYNTTPSFSISDASVTEGGTLTYTVTRSGPSTTSNNVSYATANGTAAGSDYTAKSGTLSFLSGQTSKTISVTTTQDSTVEGDETVYVNLSSPTGGATLADAQGIGTIVNDDYNGTIVVNSAGVAQSPYTIETISNPYPFYFVLTMLKDSGGIAVYTISGFDLCASGGTFSDTKYSFTGNGCEIIYQP